MTVGAWHRKLCKGKLKVYNNDINRYNDYFFVEILYLNFSIYTSLILLNNLMNSGKLIIVFLKVII